MTALNIQIKLHVEVGASGMPERIPYVHVNDVKLIQLKPDELQTAVNVMQRMSDHMEGFSFQVAPELAF